MRPLQDLPERPLCTWGVSIRAKQTARASGQIASVSKALAEFSRCSEHVRKWVKKCIPESERRSCKGLLNLRQYPRFYTAPPLALHDTFSHHRKATLMRSSGHPLQRASPGKPVPDPLHPPGILVYRGFRFRNAPRPLGARFDRGRPLCPLVLFGRFPFGRCLPFVVQAILE